MASAMVSPGSCRMALVTSSLVSRTAMSGSTRLPPAQMAVRTWRRASAAAAGPETSRAQQECSRLGRVAAIRFIGSLGVLSGV
jgi:hypothetical protein